MQTMSVRGTITERTLVSPSSNTEWISSASVFSIMSASEARSSSSRNSSSVKNAASGPWVPGATAEPIFTSQPGMGPRTVRSSAHQSGSEDYDAGDVAAADLARRDSDQHKTDAGHRDGSQQPCQPEVFNHQLEGHGNGDRRGHFEPDPPEPQRVHVRHRVLQDPLERFAGAAAEQRFCFMSREVAVGCLGGGKESGQHHEGDGHDH